MNHDASPGGRRAVFGRFLVAGALNTLFGLAVYAAAVTLGLPVWAALLAANAAGLGFNFVTTGGYAFRQLALSRWPRFAATYVGLYLLNWAGVGLLGRLGLGPIAAQSWLTLPMALGSFWALSTWVFAPGRGDRMA